MVSKTLPASLGSGSLGSKPLKPSGLLEWEAGASTLDQGNSLDKGCHVLGEFFSAASFTPPCLAQVGPCGLLHIAVCS